MKPLQEARFAEGKAQARRTKMSSCILPFPMGRAVERSGAEEELRPLEHGDNSRNKELETSRN